MNKVSIEDLECAIMWLEENEGGDDERASMLRVAEWLKQKIKMHQLSVAVRQICRETGATRSQAYRALRAKLSKS